MVELDQFKYTLSTYETPLKEVRDSLNLEAKIRRIDELDKTMEEPSFWEDAEKSTRLVKEAKNLKDTVAEYNKLQNQYEEIGLMIEMGYEENDPEIVPEIQEMLDEFGLQHIRKSKGIQLSGGERRRTEIARALSIAPKFILLDEPFAGVDPIAVEDIQSIVIKLKEKNIGILITDHNVQETLCITDRAYLLYDGRILQSGSAEDLANDPEVRRVYLGKNFELRRKK